MARFGNLHLSEIVCKPSDSGENPWAGRTRSLAMHDKTKEASMKPCALLLAAGLLTAALNCVAREPWRPLLNGSIAGWDTFMAKPDPAWDVPGMTRGSDGKYAEPIGLNRDPLGVFRFERIDGKSTLHISGQGFGVLTTRESFSNFHLRLQVKWGERKWGVKSASPRDSGLLYFVHGEPGFDHGTWPRSIEFQIEEHNMGDLYALSAQIAVTAKATPVPGKTSLYVYDPQGERTVFVPKLPVGARCMRSIDAENPPGEWNTIELIVLGDQSIHIVNSKVVMRLEHPERLDGPEPVPLTAGQISLQTEGAEVYFRNVEIRPISAIPAKYAVRK
jgi:Domain of Unknown Function (DUF1080)